MGIDYDVAIVGYGPTGMTAASLLGRLGHSVVVIERWPGLYGLPRLTHIDDETARTIQAASDAEDALRDSSPTHYHWVNGKEETLLMLPSVDGNMGYPAHISMYQPDIESAIDRRIREFDNVTLRQGWALAEIEQDTDAVTLTMGTWDGAAISETGREKIRARYVIAADGSKSRVRELLGIGRDDLGFNEQWVNVDTEWKRTPDPAFNLAKQFCDPARGHMFMAIGARRQRFEYAVLPSDDLATIGSEERAWQFLKEKHSLTPDDVTIVRRLVYTFEARIAQTWRAGRILLAGDAAHTMPPNLGQGACSGMRDANNLAWKLDLVLSGSASDELLDSYESERRPHVTALTHMSIGLGHVANMRDVTQAEERDAAFRSGHAPPPPQFPPIQGAIRSEAGAGAPALGFPTPQGRLRSQDQVALGDEILGYGFVLLSRTNPEEHLSSAHRAILESARVTILSLDGDIEDVDGRYGSFLERLGAEAVLIRPDFLLYGTASSGAEIGRLLEDLASGLELVDQAASRVNQ